MTIRELIAELNKHPHPDRSIDEVIITRPLRKKTGTTRHVGGLEATRATMIEVITRNDE